MHVCLQSVLAWFQTLSDRKHIESLYTVLCSSHNLILKGALCSEQHVVGSHNIQVSQFY